MTPLNNEKKTKIKPVSESRKIRKPLMERKRRNRINTSLSALAKILIDSKKVKTENSKSSRLEKADILELTVEHIKTLNDSKLKESTFITENDKFKNGFSKCVNIIDRIFQQPSLDSMRERLLKHLRDRLKKMDTNDCSEIELDSELNIHEAVELNCEPQVSSKLTKDECIVTGRTSNSTTTYTLVPQYLPNGNLIFTLNGNEDKFMAHIKSATCVPTCGIEQESKTTPEAIHETTVNSLSQHEHHEEYVYFPQPECFSHASKQPRFPEEFHSFPPDYHSIAQVENHCPNHQTLNVSPKTISSISLCQRITSSQEIPSLSSNPSHNQSQEKIGYFPPSDYHDKLQEISEISNSSKEIINYFPPYSTVKCSSPGLNPAYEPTIYWPPSHHVPRISSSKVNSLLTPPPSPPENNKIQRNSSVLPLNERDGILHPEDQQFSVRDGCDQPFDLRVNRTWRPW